MQLVQGGCFQPDCTAPLGRRRMAQKPALHFWRRHSALRVCRLRPVKKSVNMPKADARLRTEEASYRTCPCCGPVPAGDRRRAGTSAAPGLPSESGRRSRSRGGRLGLPARIRFRRFQTDFAGRAEGPAENPAGRGLCGVLLSGRERPVAFPVCDRGESSWKPECGNARLQKRQLAVAPENGAKKSACAMGSERRRAPCHTGLFCAAWAAIRAVARGVRRRKAVSGQKKSTFLKKGKYLSVFS